MKIWAYHSKDSPKKGCSKTHEGESEENGGPQLWHSLTQQLASLLKQGTCPSLASDWTKTSAGPRNRRRLALAELSTRLKPSLATNEKEGTFQPAGFGDLFLLKASTASGRKLTWDKWCDGRMSSVCSMSQLLPKQRVNLRARGYKTFQNHPSS